MIISLIGVIEGIALYKIIKEAKSRKQNDSIIIKKNIEVIKLLDKMLYRKQRGHTIENYLKEHNLQTVAIYGMSYVGFRLYDELKQAGVVVKYGIDQNAERIRMQEIDILYPDEELPEVDAIIVTATFFYEEIEKKLSRQVSAKVYSLKEILYDI